MLECRVHGAQDLRITEAPVPRPGPGEVLVRLGAAGICGSDMHYYFDGAAGSFRIREPLVPGHEASGVVAGVADGVDRVQPGDHIAINPSRPCGCCPRCREGRVNLCERMRFLGSASVFPHMQGMFREYFLVPQDQCVPVPQNVSLQALAMSEPLAVAMHSVDRAGNLQGARVLITGSGTIGCMLTIAAKLAGAAHVTVTDVVDHPLAVAQRVGADQVVRADQLPADQPLSSVTGEPDVAFEVSGDAAALATCLQTVRRGGIIVQVGTLPAQPVPLPANLVMTRELDLRGSFRFGNVFDKAVQVIANRQVDVTPVLSGIYPLTDAARAITLARDKRRSMKVQLQP